MNESELLTTAEAAKQTGYSEGHIRRLCREGKIKAMRGEGRNAPWLIDRLDLYRYVDKLGRYSPIADVLVDYADRI